MTASYRVSWDEENSPNAFFVSWSICQCIVLACGLLIKLHILRSMAMLQKGNPAWVQLLGVFGFILLLVTLSLYLNLLMNGVWHRNPEVSTPVEGDSDSLDISPLNLQASAGQTAKPESPALFEQSLLKNPDPIVQRDHIQWKRMLLATGGICTLVLSLALCA